MQNEQEGGDRHGQTQPDQGAIKMVDDKWQEDKDGDRTDFLVPLPSRYEVWIFPIRYPSPVDTIKAVMRFVIAKSNETCHEKNPQVFNENR